MTKIRITKKFTFEMAHFLDNYNGKCRNIHGHSYKLSVTCLGNIQNNGMVMDFSALKQIVNQEIIEPLDHALLVKTGTEISNRLTGLTEKIIPVNYQPTCENMVAVFAEKISKNLPPEVQLMQVKLYETATSYAEWRKEDNL